MAALNKFGGVAYETCRNGKNLDDIKCGGNNTKGNYIHAPGPEARNACFALFVDALNLHLGVGNTLFGIVDNNGLGTSEITNTNTGKCEDILQSEIIPVMPKVREATCQHHRDAWKAPQWCCQDDQCGGSPSNQCTSTSTFHNTVQTDGTAPQGCWAPGITATTATMATLATTATTASPATVTATSITTGNPIYMVACDSKHGTDHIGWQCSSKGPTCFGDPRSVSSCAAVERFLSNNGYDDCKCHPDVADCKGGACNDKKGDCINLEPGPSTRGVVAYPLMPGTTYSWNNPKGKEVTGGSCIDQAENHEAKFDRITTWSHLVVDLDTLQVQADSTAYATHLVGEGINGSTYLQLGYARSCSSSNLGNAVIDLRGSPFAITGEESCTCAVPQETPCICGQWTSKGWNNQMELKCTENNQRCVVRCGGQTGNCELTNGYLQLEYVAKTNDEYYASTKELEEECEVASVSCGNHVAPTCGDCAPVHISGTDLSRYCNGICAWHNNKCILKSQATTTASTTSVTTNNHNHHVHIHIHNHIHVQRRFHWRALRDQS